MDRINFKGCWVPVDALIEGVIISIYKERGMISMKAIEKIKDGIRKLTGRYVKVGHGGTLDPFAEGLLPCLFGRATKYQNRIMQYPKEYEITILFGADSPSLDIDTPVTYGYPYQHITEELLIDCLNTFKGSIEQYPPIYSAKKIGGKPAYEFARAGISSLQLKAVKVVIYDIELIDFSPPYCRVRVECGSGAYMRALARDIAEKLSTKAVVTHLIRKKVGPFNVSGALKITEFLDCIEV